MSKQFNSAFYNDTGITLQERVNNLTGFEDEDPDFINNMLAEGATDVLMKVKKLNPVDYKFFTVTFEVTEDFFSTGNNLYYPSIWYNRNDSSFLTNFIIDNSENPNEGASEILIEINNTISAEETTLAAGVVLKILGVSTGVTEQMIMEPFLYEMVKITAIEDSTAYSPTVGYSLKKITVIRGLNGDNTILQDFTGTPCVVPLETLQLRIAEIVDVQRYDGENFRFASESSPRDRFKLTDSESFLYATKERPVHYAENGLVNIIPVLGDGEKWLVSCGATPSYVGIDSENDKRLDNISEKYEGPVCLYAALKVITRLWQDIIKSEEDAELAQSYGQIMQSLQLQYISALQIPPSKQDKQTVQQQSGG